MDQKSFDLIVIGAGPGGIEAALFAAKEQLSVCLVSATKIGGRATWGSLVPSKVWLASAEKADALRSAENFAFEPVTEIPPLNLDKLRKKVGAQSQASSDRYLQKLNEAGVHLLYGTAVLHQDKKVIVTKEDHDPVEIQGNHIIIGSGSEPMFKPGIKPNMDHIIAPKIASGILKIPESLVMAGGGVTGTEYAYAFAALGTRVTILQNSDHLLPRLDKEVSLLFENYLTSHYPIEIVTNASVESMIQTEQKVVTTTRDGRTFDSEYGFIAIGRKADLSFIAEESMKPRLTEGNTVEVNDFCQTSIPGIYAIGDVTGAPMTANRATMQARVSVSHILRGKESTLFPGAFIEAIYTSPAIAQIGDMSQEEDALYISKSYNDLLKSNIRHKTEGFLKIKISKTSGLILGAAGYGDHIPDVMAVIQVAMNNNLLYHDINKLPLAYPSASELITSLD